ncbi:small multidrug resistance protein [filamentous cyanobacterium CCT1]|nr:small multidrug resistance protein [filamentous cyanobacterium CCT1]PSN81122.1 small multidrug resistance protein [filamentous cyanobacterium CCP4]
MTTVVMCESIVLLRHQIAMAHSVGYGWVLLGLSATGTCAGNLLLKQANLALAKPGMVAIATSPWFLSAIACYIFDLVFFAQALQQLPVSTAVPVVSGIRIAATAILAYVCFGEHLTGYQLFAASLITAGIVIMSRAQ